MSSCDEVISQVLIGLAESEIAAFLAATTELLGPGCPGFAADAWLHVMGTLPWPGRNYEKFFRSVSVLAIAQLGSMSAASPDLGYSEAHQWNNLAAKLQENRQDSRRAFSETAGMVSSL